MASELRVNTLKDASGNNSVATSVVFAGSAKAWTHFQGTSTAAHVDSNNFNTSSVDDDGTGDYGLHFTNNMGNATYAVTFGADDDGSSSVVIGSDTTNGTMAAGSFDFESYYVNSSSNRTDYDYANIYIVVHGDLA